ncbi:hypothetical protein CPB84DRAFT_1792933 [Gymnopilus junonius]|uniref:Uncharacterized protein n=1 Tax=Gymnopilus junonius TaxID=109634 RepID=A0A9P5NF87_GYMJU|nr:hypothetical protein CPB84DRAFT_1792933 [Gymnopilus junonius]
MDGDVLQLIFSMNADMFHPLEYNLALHQMSQTRTEQSALDTTLITSRSPSIWGQILQLQRLHDLGSVGREEIVKRTGNAALSILREFFIPLIRSNWSRIQNLYIRVKLSQSPWSFTNSFLLPAPSLESFNVHFEEVAFKPFSQPDVFFSRHAPLLKGFGIYTPPIYFNLQGPWINHIRIFEMTSPKGTILETMNLIKQMHCLEHLSLVGIEGHPKFTFPDPDSIVLPHLIYLHLHGQFPIPAALALGIKPAAYCTLHLIASINQPADPSDATYAQSHFSIWNVSALDVVLNSNIFSCAVGEADRRLPFIPPSLSTSLSPYFRVLLVTEFPLTGDNSILFTPFLKCDLSTVRFLDLKGPFLDVVPFLRSLSGVEELYTSICGEDAYPKPLLPHLKRIELGQPAINSEECRETLLKFYEYRKDRGLSVPILDLGKSQRRDCRYLEVVSGLRYICGSGGEEKLYYGLGM